MNPKLFLTLFFLFFVLCSCGGEHEPALPASAAETGYAPEDWEYVEADDKPCPDNCIDGGKQLQYDGGRLYFLNGSNGKRDQTLMTLNLKTGMITSVCPDPLCDHATPDCPFYGIVPLFYVCDGKIFYKRMTSYTYRNPDGTPRYRVDIQDSVFYDTESGKVHVLETYDKKGFSDYTLQLFYNGRRYYCDHVYSEELDKYILKICRLDIASEKSVVIGGENNADGVFERFLFVLNERIYFTDGVRLYSRTLENTDEITHSTGQFDNVAMTDGTDIFFDRRADGPLDVYRMTDPNDAESAARIIEGCTNWTLTGRYIYYLDGQTRSAGKNRLDGYDGDEVELYGKELRRCAHDGLGDELVFSFEGDYGSWQIRHWLAVDNYIYGLFTRYDDVNGDGAIDDGEVMKSDADGRFGIMRIDVENGSVRILETDS